MSRHVPREVAEAIPVDRLEVWQQEDGLWRWRWLSASGETDPLLASHGFESAEEAEESARSAYPATSRVVVAESRRPVVAAVGHRAGRGCGALVTTAVVAVLVALRRRRVRA
ncbi:MAG TPA: hypothetical protein VFM09_12435 [Marmoricola sp.]|nr:hypothetical protein [Marmoricola sp.]